MPSPRPSSPPITRPAARSERASARSPQRPRRRQAVARQPHRSLVVAELGKRSRPSRSATRSGGRSRSVGRRATQGGPERGRRLRPTGAPGLVPATDHDLDRRHHRHVLHVHFIAGRAAADRWLGQYPAGIVLELDDAHELGAPRPLLHGLGASRRALGHKTLPASLSVDEVLRLGDRLIVEPGGDHWHGTAPRPFHDPPPHGRGRRRRHARDRR
jgi:hypothetical protein